MRGQTSMETLLVMAFILVLATMIALPYTENQSRTNLGIQTKLLILPYIERNGNLVKISLIRPEITPVSGGRHLEMYVGTIGHFDTTLIGSGLPLVTSAACASICSRIDSAHFVTSTHFVWENRATSSASPVPICDLSC